ncbi:MAG: hypothetical protein RBT11_07540 [Desulfobacterales bacterium]|jgi:hypothetical protein|nr:hypothetical protein [Desulfobacterales bacterium]
MEIRLDLYKHCIQTSLKRLQEQTLSNYFANRIDEITLEQTLSFVQCALNNLDFPRLRSQYPDLAGGTHAKVVLSMDEAGQLTLTINGNPIAP